MRSPSSLNPLTRRGQTQVFCHRGTPVFAGDAVDGCGFARHAGVTHQDIDLLLAESLFEQEPELRSGRKAPIE